MTYLIKTMPPSKTQQFLADLMMKRTPIQRTSWQGTSAPSATYELRNVVLEFAVPDSISQWQNLTKPDVSWAEEHFQERVSGKALNPTPSYVRWPWHSAASREAFIRDGGRFDHTYPERYWPEWGGQLEDVAHHLRKDPWSRQAYLPVWFPEDTGATQGQRVPCTLGYHFVRNGPTLDINYFLRSCDLTRHYLNDVYLTGRLLQWMVEQTQGKDGFPYPGTLTMFVSNLHLFTADKWRFE